MSVGRKLLWFNFIMTLVWMVLAIPSLIWWSESILWVILISLWANIVGHFSAYIAGRSEVSQQVGYNLTDKDKKWLEERLAILLRHRISRRWPDN